MPPQPGTPRSPCRGCGHKPAPCPGRGCGGLGLPACCSPGSSGYRKRPGPFLDSKPQPQPLGAAQSPRQGDKPLPSVFQTPIGFFPLCRPREAVCGLPLLGAAAEAWAGWGREDADPEARHRGRQGSEARPTAPCPLCLCLPPEQPRRAERRHAPSSVSQSSRLPSLLRGWRGEGPGFAWVRSSSILSFLPFCSSASVCIRATSAASWRPRVWIWGLGAGFIQLWGWLSAK